MNDGITPDASGSSETGASVPSARAGPGARLREARERLNLSLEDVASQIKTAPRKLAALEAERWSELPERPYLRGLIRNYARVLQLDSEPLLALVEDALGGVVAPPAFDVAPSLRAPFPQRPSGPHDSSLSRLMMIGVFVCAVVIGALVIPGTAPFRDLSAMVSARLHRPAVGAAVAADEAGQASVVSQVADARMAPALGSAEGLAQTSSDKPAPLVAAATAPATLSSGLAPGAPMAQIAPRTMSELPAAAATDPAAALVLQFTDDSWVEVRQADGRVLSSQIYHSGTEQAIDAHSPLEVVIGNAPAVSLSYRGKAVDLDPYTHSRVARLNLP